MTNLAKYIDRDPPLEPDDQSITDYLAYLKERINFLFHSWTKNTAKTVDFVTQEGVVSAGGKNWFVRKWNNGRCDCYLRRIESSLAVTNAAGSIYRSAPLSALTYPVTFKEPPHEWVEVAKGVGWKIGTTTGATTTESGVYRIACYSSTTQDYIIEYKAEGRI